MFEAKLKLPFIPISTLCSGTREKGIRESAPRTPRQAQVCLKLSMLIQNLISADDRSHQRLFARHFVMGGATVSGEKRHRGAPTCKRNFLL
ncbi:hypothetical protein HYDPIDRAFT_105330 [Hydnomerulius pinastri MD-312]|nr:hypothetical protein HYDPIDRAFT_105330 [Hydnomerulius pinastri MD-312]